MADKKYVIFRLEKEKYGIDIQSVNEITDIKEISEIPNTPYFIEGIINLRGQIVPIINLKKRLKITTTKGKNETRFIVINIFDKKVGIIVDEASQVLTIDERNIEPPSDIITGIDTHYINGIANLEDELIIILRIDELITNIATNITS